MASSRSAASLSARSPCACVQRWPISSAATRPIHTDGRNWSPKRLDGFGENREVERFAWPKPDHMFGMIGKILPRARMSEDREAMAVKDDPLGEVAKLVGQDRKLT